MTSSITQGRIIKRKSFSGPITRQTGPRTCGEVKLTSLNGIGKAAACDLGSHLIAYFLLSAQLLGLLADVNLHLTEVRRAAKILIACGFALDCIYRPFDFGDLSIDGGIVRSWSGIHFRGIPPAH